MAEHIDRDRLRTNLRYRFDYLSKFLNFTKDDITILNSLAPIIFPCIPTLVENIYKKLFSFDITKQYFICRNDRFESFSVEQSTDTSVLSVQIDFRKDMLSMYLKKVFLQTEWNDIFLQYLSQVGEIHTESDHTVSTCVSYIHINNLLGYLERLLIDIIWNTENLDKNKICSSIKTINKFFCIQNDFFTMHYLNPSQDDSTSSIDSIRETKCCFK